MPHGDKLREVLDHSIPRTEYNIFAEQFVPQNIQVFLESENGPVKLKLVGLLDGQGSIRASVPGNIAIFANEEFETGEIPSLPKIPCNRAYLMREPSDSEKIQFELTHGINQRIFEELDISKKEIGDVTFSLTGKKATFNLR